MMNENNDLKYHVGVQGKLALPQEEFALEKETCPGKGYRWGKGYFRNLVTDRSLILRVVFFVSIWIMIAFSVIAVIISTLYRTSSEHAFTDLLRAHLETVIEAVSFNDEGSLNGPLKLGKVKFSQPNSGWVWQVDPIDEKGKINGQSLSSSSLGHEILPLPSLSEVGFDKEYIRSYQIKDSFGNQIFIIETEVELNDENKAVRIRVGGNLNALEADINAFIRQMMIAFFIAGLGTLLINMMVILYGFKPLDRVRTSLMQIRSGSIERLSNEFPQEIAPLTREVNALIDSNKRIIERARMQVGNLAHSLKTPIAIILNEIRYLPKDQGDLIKNQMNMMQNQIKAYLDRARISSQRGSGLARIDIIPSLTRLLRVMKKLNPDIEFRIEQKTGDSQIAMEIQDFEEVMGNLIENAARFTTSEVRISIDEADDPDRLSITVSDNGKGLLKDEKERAMKRGILLDETRSENGLGLSIVHEIVDEYHGQFILLDADMGGLAAQLQLPKP